jgi:hypothetical protein
MTEIAKLLSPAVNFAVVQLPHRQYPGVVVQGDTLNGLVSQLGRMQSLLDRNELEELRDEITEMLDQLEGALDYYKLICAKHSIS